MTGRTAPLDDYERGWLEGMAAYAYNSSEPWAENGVLYVGTMGKTRREAAIEFLLECGFDNERAKELAG